MQLCIDVGNSFAKMAVFKDHEIKHFTRVMNLKISDIEEICELFPIESVIYSASGQDNQDIIRHVQTFEHHILLKHTTPMPIRIKYKTPSTLGKDRIASVMGAYSLYPGENVVIVDMGTCITYEVLTKEGDYLGGNIAPGVEMRLKAMHQFTAKLPLVEFDEIDDWIGYSTETAIRNGAVLGTIMEVESFLVRAKEKFGQIRTILTGGAADFFAKKINSEIFVDQYLVHRGLNEILRHED